MTYDELQEKIFDILPDAHFDTDENGQIIIYTAKKEPLRYDSDKELRDHNA